MEMKKNGEVDDETGTIGYHTIWAFMAHLIERNIGEINQKKLREAMEALESRSDDESAEVLEDMWIESMAANSQVRIMLAFKGWKVRLQALSAMRMVGMVVHKGAPPPGGLERQCGRISAALSHEV